MLGKDLGFAARTLRRSPAFALTAVVTLALGIGATTALFSVVNGVLLRPLPWPDADRLVLVYGTRGESRSGHSTALFSIGIRNGSVCTWSRMSNSTSCFASVATIASRR